MTRKEFITNFVRGLNFTAVKYWTGDGRAYVRVENKEGKEGVFAVFSDRIYTGKASIKFKPVFLPKDSDLDLILTKDSSVDVVRKANAWLAERGFRAVAKYQPYVYRSGSGYLKIMSEGFPWDQCLKVLSDSEAIEDGLGPQSRYGVSGNVLA